MKVKLKPWNEVVELAKRHDSYDFDGNVEYVFGMTERTLPWGGQIESRPADNMGDYFMGDDWWVHGWMVEDADADDILRYGKIITDDMLYDNREFGIAHDVRIRLIKYDGQLYYHKMVDGTVVECRRVGIADA